MNLALLPRVPTKNHGPKRAKTDICVWHSTAGGTALSSLQWLARPNSGAGYHYVIERDGVVTGSTPIDHAAYHAGLSAHPVPAGGVPRGASVNRRSIGISFANKNDGTEAITEAQIAAAVELVKALSALYPWIMKPEAHVRHRDVAPGRKTDPLPSALDWTAFVARIT